jgi:hypothetical protein
MKDCPKLFALPSNTKTLTMHGTTWGEKDLKSKNRRVGTKVFINTLGHN